MGSVTKLDRIHVRITTELNEKFKAICEQNSINGSALIRKWIEEFVAEHEKPMINMNILDIVWKLNNGREHSIWNSCVNVAERLGYDDDPRELFDDVITLLVERAQDVGNFSQEGVSKYGKATVNNEKVYFSISDGGGTWSIETPPWLSK